MSSSSSGSFDQSSGSFDQGEVLRLRDLLPASLRPLISIEAIQTPGSVIQVKRTSPWQPTGIVQLDFRRWLSLPQPQRDLLFLREIGWFDSRNWLQPGPYQALALVGSLATLGELALQNPVSVLLAGGITALAIRQIWQNLNQESVQFDADEFALRRAKFRGYERQEAARHLISGLEAIQKLDRTDIVSLLRLQRLQAIAQTTSPSTSG